MKNIYLILILLVASVGFQVWADDDEPKALSSMQERASKRLYPGGKDEEDLKVLPQVPEPNLKINRQAVQGDVMKSMSGQGNESTPAD